MRRFRGILGLLLALALLPALAGCETDQREQEQNVYQNSASTEASGPEETGELAPASAYDLDLLACSPTVVYAEVFNMMNEPDAYLGKHVRMEGVMASYRYPDSTVYGCIIADATACCQQGMEFVLREDDPEAYPEPGSEIVVSGYFNTYQNGDFTFCNLIDCSLERVSAPQEEEEE